MQSDMNMNKLRPSRTKPCEGDLFIMSYSVGYLFGRVVVGTIPDDRPMPDCSVVYVYNKLSKSTEVDIGALNPSNLLVPPQVFHHGMWRSGYCETIGNEPLKSADLLPATCFWDPVMEHFVNENGHRAQVDAVEQYEIWGMYGAAQIDQTISEALGIPSPSDS